MSKYIKSDTEKFEFITYYDYLSTASLIDEGFVNVKLPTNLKLNDYEIPNNYDFLLAFWEIPSDPDQYFFWHSTQKSSNITNYKNVKIDKLLEDGRSSIFPADRKKYYIDFQKTIVDDLPAIFLYYPYVYTIERK